MRFQIIAQIMLLSLAMVFAGCTRRPKNAVVEPSKKEAPSDQDQQNGDASPFNDQDDGLGGEQDQGTISVSFLESELRQADPTFSVAEGVSYSFAYLNVNRTGSIVFQNGSGTISLANLPTGRSGEITLVLLQNNVKRFEGKSAAITLQAGANTAKIQMNAVQTPNPGPGPNPNPGPGPNPNPGPGPNPNPNPNPNGANLDLELEYGPGPGPNPNPNPGPGPNPNPNPSPNPNLDPRIANWDGKQDLVISNVWKIIDLN